MRGLAIAIVLVVAIAAPARAGVESWRHGGEGGRALVCTPEGPGPFPAVVFNHGLVVDKHGYEGAARRGYDLDGICRALAADGFLAFAPIRGSGRGDIAGHLSEVVAAVAAAGARPEVDGARLALAGFSRGGLLTLMAATRLAGLGAVVLLAPAPGRGHFERALADIDRIDAPVLVMVEAGDDAVIRKDVDDIDAALRAAGRPAEVIRYDGGGGHRLFWTVGSYWPDLSRFLKRHLAPGG